MMRAYVAIGCVIAMTSAAVAQSPPPPEVSPEVSLEAPAEAHAADAPPPTQASADASADVLVGPDKRPYTLHIYWENDGEYFKWNNPTDRYYTNGVGLHLSFQADWVQSLAEYMPFADQFGPAHTGAGLVVAQQIFTPGNIAATIPLPEDRPYAGYLYGGLFWQRQGEAALFPGARVATLDHFQLDLGIVGPSSLAEDAQSWIHEDLDVEEPMGWDNQLRDEPTAQLTVRKKWRFNLHELWHAPDSITALGVQAIPEIGGTVGNVHRHIEAGATFRAGWNLPDDFGPGRLTNAASTTNQRNLFGRGVSFYGYARLTGRAVEHNMFIEGNTWKDSLGVDEEPLVGELQLGAMLAYNWRNWTAAFGYAQTFQTEEFKNQDGKDAWGAYTIRVTAWF